MRPDRRRLIIKFLYSAGIAGIIGLCWPSVSWHLDLMKTGRSVGVEIMALIISLAVGIIFLNFAYRDVVFLAKLMDSYQEQERESDESDG